MRWRTMIFAWRLVAAACSPQPLEEPPPAAVTVFEGARLIVGDGSPPIENAAFVVEGDRFALVGRRDEVQAPANAVRVDLSEKTVMPALIDAHSHIGYMKDLTSGPENYTREHILDHMYRFAYHGVAASQSMGSDFGVMPFQLRDEILAGKYPDAARFLTAGRGLAPPDEILPTNMRHAAYVVTTEEGARANVRELKYWNVRLIKTWVDDRGGNVEKLAANLYQAIIDEAHKNGMRVLVHATGLEDAKAVLRAGVDVFGHMVTEVDDELIALFRERPQTGILLAQVGRRMIYSPYLEPPDPFLLETVTPAQIARLRDRVVSQTPEELERAREQWDRTAENIMKLHDAGVRIAIGSDGGGQGGDRFIGFTAHTELENMVAAGMSPAEAIVAGTKNGAEILGIENELGTVERGKSADFIVLDANPLDDITNSRKIDRVYLRGHRIDRARLREMWAAGASSSSGGS
ncbi:MAG TPA: amidohydrolase family protein [Vicinamibacteria bacterium]|nr:amidohydrolase family protein [Vicinamibacteria bacterium]